MSAKKAALISGTVTVLSVAVQIILGNLQSGSDLVVIGCFTGYELEPYFALITWISVMVIIAAFLVTPAKYRLAKGVSVPVAVIFVEIPLTFYLLLTIISSYRSPSDPVKLKSPDGKHCIVRTVDLIAGSEVYSYYIKDKGIIYRHIFDGENSVSDPDFEWTDNGILYKDKLYEY